MVQKADICPPIKLAITKDAFSESVSFLYIVNYSCSPTDIDEAFHRFASRYGARVFSMLIRPKRSIGPETYTCFGFGGKEYTRDYIDNRYPDIDYCAHQALQGVLPMCWGMAEHRKNYDKNDRKLYGFAGEYGIHHGMIIPVHTPDFSSVIGFADDGPEEEFRKRFPELACVAHMFGVFTASAIQRLDLAPRCPVVSKLTARELECLRWAAAGKTAWEISVILGISERTAVAHSENAKKNLNARTLPHAVALAFSQGLITI